MNENLLKVVDALINDDETMASEYLRQALVEKMRDRLGINESVLVFGYAKMHQNPSPYRLTPLARRIWTRILLSGHS